MNEAYTDRLVVVNGPEDGVAFPIMRTPITIGAATNCDIFLHFDKKILPKHARVTVVSGGYRIRSIAGALVYINGKRSGMVRARIARSGDIVQVGATSLCLLCAADGLAKRSLGMPSESNVGWLLRSLVHRLVRAGSVTLRLLFKRVSRP